MSYCFNPTCESPQNPDEADLCQSCGSTLLLKDRYRLIQLLGQGSRHRTFLALDEDRPARTYCSVQQFFPTAEIDLGSAIDPSSSAIVRLDELGEHSQIPELFAAFKHEGNFYLIQEYIEGTNLAQELEAEGPFKEVQIRQLLEEILPVLEFVHDRQLIHRDLKPENLIRRASDETLTLVDFGSVQYSRSQSPIKTGAMMGSAEYAAPEQTRGRAIASSDLYSLGVICIHLLTDISPFQLFDDRSDAWMWRSYLKTPISQPLAHLLDRLIHPSPKHRYQSASEVLEDLRSAKRPMWLPPQPTKLTLAALGWVSMALGLTFLNQLPDGKPVLQPTPLQETTPRLKHFAPLELPKGIPTQTLTSGWGSIWSIGLSPDGKTLVSGGYDGMIQIRELTQACLNSISCKPTRILTGHSGPVWSIAVSPNGRLFASASEDKTVKVWNLRTGQLLRTFKGHQGEVYTIAFSPDGQALASGSEDGTVKLWNLSKPCKASSMSARTLRGHRDEVKSLTFSPNGDVLVTGSADRTVKLWNLQTGREKLSLKHSDPVWSVAVSPDGGTLATGSEDSEIALWDTRTGSRLKTFSGHTQLVQSLTFSPDGQTLASGDSDGTIRLWNLGSGGMLGKLRHHYGWVDMAFSPDGKVLLSGGYDETIELWQPH